MNGFEILPSAGGGSDPLKLDLAGGTMTGQLVLQLASATGAVNVSPVWNNGATTFAGIYGRVTNTASGASSKLIDLGTVADGSVFSVSKAGAISAASISCTAVIASYGFFSGYAVAVSYGTGMIRTTDWTRGVQWSTGSIDSAPFLALGPSADNTATLQLGINHATTATAQTIKAHNVTTGTGADLVLKGGTGSVNGGMVKLSNSSNDVRLSVGDDGVGFFSAAPKPQATTFSGGGSHAAGSGTGVTDDSTFDGYTIGQIVAGLRSFGLFA